jgi:hypothetical protein
VWHPLISLPAYLCSVYHPTIFNFMIHNFCSWSIIKFKITKSIMMYKNVAFLLEGIKLYKSWVNHRNLWFVFLALFFSSLFRKCGHLNFKEVQSLKCLLHTASIKQLWKSYCMRLQSLCLEAHPPSHILNVCFFHPWESLTFKGPMTTLVVTENNRQWPNDD